MPATPYGSQFAPTTFQTPQQPQPSTSQAPRHENDQQTPEFTFVSRNKKTLGVTNFYYIYIVLMLLHLLKLLSKI